MQLALRSKLQRLIGGRYFSSGQRLDDFSRIAVKHGTDKFGGHLYTPIYHKLFAPVRYRKLKILEIGIGGYGSALAGGLGLSTLAEYFPAASIVGLDITEKRLEPHPRITTVQGSQADEALLDRLWAHHGPFDIVIDDGSHLPDHVLTTFRCLYPRMGEDGIYVVEDTQTSLWPDYCGRTDGSETIFALAYQVGIAMQVEEAKAGGGTPAFVDFGTITKAVRCYRNLIVFERGDNDYPSNVHLDAQHKNVAQVRRAIEHEGQVRPSPGFYLTRIDMEIASRRQSIAVELAREAMERYPKDRTVLIYVHRIFTQAGLNRDSALAAKRLFQIAPSDPEARQLYAACTEA